MVHNHNINKSVPFKEDDKVRILEEKGKFDKVRGHSRRMPMQ
jgi:hypothetical protein